MIYYALLSFFVFEYLRPGAYIPGLDALRLNGLIPLACIIGTIAGKPPVSNREFVEELNTKLLLTLLGLMVISTLFAIVTLYAFTITKIVFTFILIYWVIVRQVGDLKRLKGVFFMLTIVHLAIAVLNPAVFTGTENRVGINSGAFLGDGNDFSLSVVICIPMCLFLMAEAKRKLTRAVWGGAVLALVLCVIATKSRGGTLALAAVGLYYWFKSQRKLQTAALFVVVMAFVLVWAPSSYFERMATMADSQESSAQGRIIAWKAGVQMALANPILGGGVGHFPIQYGNFYHVEGTPWLTAHSIYFLLLGELGVPGLAVLLTFIIGNFIANRRLSTEATGLPPPQATTARNALASTSAALVAYATGGAFLSAAYYPHMYVLAGILAAGRHVVRVQIKALEQAVQGAVVTAETPSAPLGPPGVSPDWRPRPAMAAGRRGVD